MQNFEAYLLGVPLQEVDPQISMSVEGKTGSEREQMTMDTVSFEEFSILVIHYDHLGRIF